MRLGGVLGPYVAGWPFICFRIKGEGSLISNGIRLTNNHHFEKILCFLSPFDAIVLRLEGGIRPIFPVSLEQDTHAVFGGTPEICEASYAGYLGSDSLRHNTTSINYLIQYHELFQSARYERNLLQHTRVKEHF